MITVDTINDAYKWLCKSHKHHLPDYNIWDFRYRWGAEHKKIMNDLNQRTYKFDVQNSNFHNSKNPSTYPVEILLSCQGTWRIKRVYKGGEKKH